VAQSVLSSNLSAAKKKRKKNTIQEVQEAVWRPAINEVREMIQMRNYKAVGDREWHVFMELHYEQNYSS
jgi:hypothetical protein